MKRAGCCVIQFGLESGNQEVLHRNRKSITLEQSTNAVQWCREAGVLSDVSFVFDLPCDNRKTIKETLKFSFRIDPDFVSYFTLVPFPETETYREGSANIRLLNERWETFSKQFYPPSHRRTCSPSISICSALTPIAASISAETSFAIFFPCSASNPYRNFYRATNLQIRKNNL